MTQRHGRTYQPVQDHGTRGLSAGHYNDDNLTGDRGRDALLALIDQRRSAGRPVPTALLTATANAYLGEAGDDLTADDLDLTWPDRDELWAAGIDPDGWDGTYTARGDADGGYDTVPLEELTADTGLSVLQFLGLPRETGFRRTPCIDSVDAVEAAGEHYDSFRYLVR